MQNSKSKIIGAKMEEYKRTQEMLNELKKGQDLLKSEIISSMKESALSCGEYVAILTPCERASLDKKALIEELGSEYMEQFTKVTEYNKFEIKKAV